MIAAIYDGLLSAGVSFEPAMTVDADRFVSERIVPRFNEAPLPDDADPLIIIATDGELYGHHQPRREHFLARLVGATAPVGRPFDTPTLAAALDRATAAGLPTAGLRQRTSWSCHHGITRWSGGCGCVTDGAWKGPLRSALERLAGGIDAATDHLIRALPGTPDPWELRDGWVDVVLGVQTAAGFAAKRLGSATREDVDVLARVMEAQRWRLAMFASCAWFWDRADRIETAGALRAATRAARLVDMIAGTDLERRMIGDLALIETDGMTGVGLLRVALAAVGAPARDPGNPSARSLRATG
jgi:hypothetical protein